MTGTIWSQARRYEWIIRDGNHIVARSGLIYTSYARAMRKLILAVQQMENASCDTP